MPEKIMLELSDEDLVYFRRVMDDVWKRNSKKAEKELVDGARRLLRQATKMKAPEYVQTRLAGLAVLVDMFDDPEWPLPDEDRRRIVAKRVRSQEICAWTHGAIRASVSSSNRSARASGSPPVSRSASRSCTPCLKPTVSPRPAEGFVHAHASATATKPVATGRPSTTKRR